MARDVKPILLVDDNANDVELTLAAFEEYHLANDIVVVRDGQEALDYMYRRGEFHLLAAGHPALILLDIKLPRLDGLAVLMQLKSDAELRQVPIVMLTASSEDSDLRSSYKLGANAYVTKPVAFNHFVDKIRGLSQFWAVINHPPPGSVLPVIASPQ